MNFTLIILGLTGIFSAIFFIFKDMYEPTFVKQDCTCGKYEKCKRITEITHRGGLRAHNTSQCGKIQDQIKRMEEYNFVKKLRPYE